VLCVADLAKDAATEGIFSKIHYFIIEIGWSSGKMHCLAFTLPSTAEFDQATVAK
jgi:hypothetical protein